MCRKFLAASLSTLLAVLALALVGPVSPASAVSIGSLADAGERAGATRLSFTAGDRIKAQVDVGNGNLLVTVQGLTLPALDGVTSVGAYYNSAATQLTGVPRLGRGWGLDFTPDVQVVDNGDSTVTLRAPGGLAGVFTATSSTAYSSPAGFKMSLVKTAYGWKLTENDSQAKLVFGSDGALTQVLDRNNNATTVTSSSGSTAFSNVSIVGPVGATAARTLAVSTAQSGSTLTTTLAQGSSPVLRQASFTRSYDDATGFTDARGRTTAFTYNGSGLLTQIAAPGGVTTQFGYDAQRRVTSITQVNGASGGPGDSVTRLAYSSATQTLLAEPNTNQSQAVTAVPRVTYTLNGAQRVTNVVDEEGRSQAKTYTANFDTATSTSGTGAGASTTTNTWGANGGQSQTASESPSGSTQSLSYANSSGPSQFNATGSTDAAGNASTYTYDGAGNPLSRGDVGSAQATVTRNTDGTVASATSPGNGSNATGYGYTNKQVSSMTPVTGSSLGARSYTYDSLGRLATATNGRGISTTYSYNANDQVTNVAYTGGASIAYGYDGAGRNNSRTETSGTTTYTYDPLGRLVGRENTAGGGPVAYTYDRSSNLASSTVQGIASTPTTTTYAFDNANVPTYIQYVYSGGQTARTTFTVDNQGRRTGTYFEASNSNTTFGGRTNTTYDASGRVATLTADLGPTSTNYTRIVNLTYCYIAGSTPAGGCSGARTADRDKLVWQKDNKTGKATTYTYSTSGRVTAASASGGTSPVSYGFGYDAKGNRTSATTSGGSSTSQALTFNAANQITTTGYSYDGAGNLKADPSTGSTQIAYSASDQVASLVKGGTTYTYTHAGTDNVELLKQTSPDGPFAYTYGRTAETGVPIVEQIDGIDSNGNPGRAQIISDPATGQPLMMRSSADVQTMYVFDGTVGAPIAMIVPWSAQAFGYDYDPYGVPILTQNGGGNGIPQNPYTFGGNGVRDRTTDWIHYGSRYYNPRTGTFTQQDTLDAPLDPFDANRYAYAGGDPINNTDPTGQKFGHCAAGAGLTIGGAGTLEAAAEGVGATGTAAAAGATGVAVTAGVLTGGLAVAGAGLLAGAFASAKEC